jgi:hypothetical protein
LTFEAAGTARMPAISQVDLSISKHLRLGHTALALTLDCFNALNAATPLSYLSNNLSTNAFGFTAPPIASTIMPPRVFRVDARFSF